VERIVDLAKLLWAHGKYQEMEATFQMAEKINPNSPTLLFERASIYIAAGRNTVQARHMLEKYLTLPLTPDNPSREEAQKLLKTAAGG
jgi:hypothetical protein